MAGERFGRRASGTADDDVRPLEQAPNYYGGQAVLEGVMMRGADRWAVAVRRPDDDIWLETHEVSSVAKRRPILRKPLLRGVYALVDSVAIGMKALNIAAEQAIQGADGEEDEEMPTIAVGVSMAIALVVFVGIFIVLPSAGTSWVNRSLLDRVLGDGAVFHFVESLVRIAVFLTYLALISLIKDIHRVFEYHGAEHKTISAWEHGDELAPATVDHHSTIHVRCGTNFLILVMLIAMIVYTVAGFIVPAPEGGVAVSIAYHVALRIVLLPLVAGVAFETLRLGAEKYDWAWVRMLMQPGLWLQRITTKPPSSDQLEVAIRAFEAVVPADALGDRVAQDSLPSRLVGPTEDASDGEADSDRDAEAGADDGDQVAAGDPPTTVA